LGLGSWVFTTKLVYPSINTFVKRVSWIFGGLFMDFGEDFGLFGAMPGHVHPGVKLEVFRAFNGMAKACSSYGETVCYGPSW
jgi:hypothetical protein